MLIYLQSPAILLVAVPLLVAAIRRLWPWWDGPARVAILTAVCGAVLGAVQVCLPWIAAFVSAHPYVSSVFVGAAAGFWSFGGHDLFAGLLSRVAPLSIDARSEVPRPKVAGADYEISVGVDASQAKAELADLAAKAQEASDAVAKANAPQP